MKQVAAWVVLFIGCLAFAILVDHGKSHLWVPDYIWLSVNLTAFLYVLYRFVGRPMGAFLEARREGIGRELQQAQQKLVDAEELRSQVLQRLQEVEREVEQMKERALTQGQAEAERIEEQTQADEGRFLRRVDEEISRRQAETRHQLAEETAALTAQLARELLAKEMTGADQKRIFDRSLAALDSLHD